MNDQEHESSEVQDRNYKVSSIKIPSVEKGIRIPFSQRVFLELYIRFSVRYPLQQEQWRGSERRTG